MTDTINSTAATATTDNTPTTPDGLISTQEFIGMIRDHAKQQRWCITEPMRYLSEQLGLKFEPYYDDRGFRNADVTRIQLKPGYPEYLTVEQVTQAIKNIHTSYGARSATGLIRRIRDRYNIDPLFNDTYTVTGTVTTNQLRDWGYRHADELGDTLTDRQMRDIVEFVNAYARTRDRTVNRTPDPRREQRA